MKAPLPENEAARLQALQAYHILDTSPEQAFDDLTLLASEICGTSMALMTLVDAHRQWFKSKVGLTITETSRDIAFCAHAILEPDVMVVPDATHDERFADNPLVQFDPAIRFYAGAPMVTPLGGALGSICVLDREPRKLTERQHEALRALSRQAVAQLELRRAVTTLSGTLAQHRQIEEQLRQRTSELHSILEALPHQYLRLAQDGTILDYSGGCVGEVRMPPTVFIGRKLYEVFPRDVASPLADALARAIRTRSAVDIEYTLPLPQGERYFDARLSPLGDDQAVAILRDNTQAKLAEMTERKAAETKAMASEAELKAIIASIPDTILILNSEGRYLKVVSPVSSQLYKPPQELLGRTLHEVFPRDQADLLLSFIQNALASRQTTRADYSLTINGVEHWFAANISPMINGYVVWVARDITDRKRAEKELREAKETAERANSAKDRFLAVLSHELRTPLTPVLATISVLGNQPSLPGDTRESLQVIQRNIELEARLIDDLLDLTRIARGKLQLSVDVVDAHAMIWNALEICRSFIHGKEMHVATELHAQQHFVRADPARLQQVFWNLLNNATKYTPAGGRIIIRTDNPRAGQIRIQISDTGIGIEPTMLPRIFKAFEQVEAPTGAGAGGLGLGLTICRAVVEAIGGTIEASSPGLNRGSAFTIHLPTTQSLPADRSDAHRPAAPPAPQPELRVLLVEDHADTARILARLLEASGHKVATAGGVEAALKIMEKQPFDLLISDLGLPDGSGLELMRQAKLRHGLRGIAISGYGMEADIRRSREAGFVEHLTKPISLPNLERAIRHATP